DAGKFERRRKGRLWRYQGKDPGRFEAVYFEADAETAADYASDIGDLVPSTWFSCARLRAVHNNSSVNFRSLPIVTLEEIREAQARLQDVAVRTRLVEWKLPQEDGRQLFLKPENQQPIGSFKLRGAYN